MIWWLSYLLLSFEMLKMGMGMLKIKHACFDVCFKQREFVWGWGVWSTSKATCCTTRFKGIIILQIIWNYSFQVAKLLCCVFRDIWDITKVLAFIPLDFTRLLEQSTEAIWYFCIRNFFSLEDAEVCFMSCFHSFISFYFILLIKSSGFLLLGRT